MVLGHLVTWYLNWSLTYSDSALVLAILPWQVDLHKTIPPNIRGSFAYFAKADAWISMMLHAASCEHEPPIASYLLPDITSYGKIWSLTYWITARGRQPVCNCRYRDAKSTGNMCLRSPHNKSNFLAETRFFAGAPDSFASFCPKQTNYASLFDFFRSNTCIIDYFVVPLQRIWWKKMRVPAKYFNSTESIPL